MGGKVVEITSTCNIGLHTPRQILGVVVECTRGLCKTNLHVDNVTDFTFLHQLADFLEVGQVAAVIGYEARHSGLFRDTVDSCAVFIAGSHRLLDVHRFAGLHCHDGKCGMRRRRSSDVNGIHIFVSNQLLCVGVPSGYLMAYGVGFGFLFVAAHDGNHP